MDVCDIDQHRPSNHGTSRRPMTMATLAPIGWIPFIQRKEPLTDALIDVRTAGFSQKLTINYFIYSYYMLHTCAITIPISSTDHGGRDGHSGRPQRLRCYEQLLNALNNNNVAQFFFKLALSLPLSIITTLYHGDGMNQYYTSRRPFRTPPPKNHATKPTAVDRGDQWLQFEYGFDPTRQHLARYGQFGRHGRWAPG